VLILLVSSKFASLRCVGEPLLPFGPGAKNGPHAFLVMQQKVVGHRAQRGRPIVARLRHAALLDVRPRGAELGWPARAA